MKKVIAVLILTIVIIYNALSFYKIPVNAASAPLAYGLYEAITMILGYELGFNKSINSMNSNMNYNGFQSFVNSYNNDESIVWNGVDTSALQDKNAFLDLMDGAINLLEQYNKGLLSNPIIDKINERSYSGSGTMASKSMFDKLKNAYALILTYEEVKYQEIMDKTLNSMVSGEVAESLESGYEDIYTVASGVISALAMSGEVSDSWSAPVEESDYLIRDLYRVDMPYNGKNLEIYKLSSFSYYDSYNRVTYSYKSNADTYMAAYKVDDGSNIFGIEFIFNNPFTVQRIEENQYGNKFYYNFEIMQNIYGHYYGYLNIAPVYNFPFETIQISNSEFSALRNEIYRFYNTEILGKNPWVDNAESVSTLSPELVLALENFFNKDITAEDIGILADQISLLGDYAGTEEAIDKLSATVAGLTVTLPDVIVDGKNDVVEAVKDLGATILTLPKSIWLEFEGVLEDIRTKPLAATKPWENGENNENSNDILLIFNGLLLLLYIIIILLRIFVHCLQLIINIFAVPASSALLPEEMVMGLEHLNSIQIPVIGLSVYSFMMGLIYILIVFYAIRILRINIDRIKVPKHTSGGL